MTSSALSLLASVEVDAASAGTAASTLHVLGAYIYNAQGHEKDLAEWGFSVERWAVAFFGRLRLEGRNEISTYRSRHEPFARLRSLGVAEAIEWGRALSGGEAVTPAHLVRGVLVDGARFTGVASSWFLEQLGGRVEALLGTKPPSEKKQEPTWRLTAAAEALLERAALLATASTDREVHVRHLLAAALTARRFPAPELLARGQKTADELLEALFTWVRPRGWDDLRELQELCALAKAAEPFEPRAVVLDNDSADGTDLLDIGRDVDAMASVIASTMLQPPLSIGLFGNWGSGKSFFMRRLHERIDKIASESRKAKAERRPSSFCADIVQIDFNAWQYADANLWASIATHVFDALNAALPGSGGSLERCLQSLAQVQERQSAKEAQRSLLAQEIARIERELNERKDAREKEPVTAGDFIHKVVELTRTDPTVQAELEAAKKQLHLDEGFASLPEARRERDQLRHFAGKLGAWWRTHQGSPRRIVFGALLVVVPLGVALGVHLLLKQGSLLGAGSAIVTSLGALFALGQSLWTTIGPAVEALDRALDRATSAEEEARAKVSDEERNALRERERLGEEMGRLNREREELERQRVALANELREAKEAASYQRFILERASSSDYRSKLGLVTTLHQDFKALSERLATPEHPHVDRIVLFIDDLDRCPPDRVVEVLQAVHLLLSFPLFVVVLAVDSRWLLQSLEAYYLKQFGRPELRSAPSATPQWASNPQHYLEKIIQIPYAIAPLTPGGFAALVDGLLGNAVVSRRAPPGIGASPRREPPPVPAPGDSSPPPGIGEAARSETPPLGSDVEPELDLTPKGLELEQAELDSLKRLGGLLGSPRAAKRLLNIYRIVRAGLDREALEAFLAKGFAIHQLCLAAVVGVPAEAAVFLRDVVSGSVARHEDLEAYFATNPDRGADWTKLERTFRPIFPSCDWKIFTAAAAGALRFSFHATTAAAPSSSSSNLASSSGAGPS